MLKRIPVVFVVGSFVAIPMAASAHMHVTANIAAVRHAKLVKANRGLPASLRAFMKAHPGGHLKTRGMVFDHPKRRSATAANAVTGNCGTSYDYISPAGIKWGWIQEYFGVSMDYILIGGGGTESWTNETTGGHAAYVAGWGFNLGGNAHTVRNAYTKEGYIYNVLYAHVVVSVFGINEGCHTPYGRPWSVTYASHP